MNHIKIDLFVRMTISLDHFIKYNFYFIEEGVRTYLLSTSLLLELLVEKQLTKKNVKTFALKEKKTNNNQKNREKEKRRSNINLKKIDIKEQKKGLGGKERKKKCRKRQKEN